MVLLYMICMVADRPVHYDEKLTRVLTLHSIYTSHVQGLKAT
jgi:hypothetical protein